MDDNQQRAFAHLGEKARTAHQEGDGLAVNHLCAIALSEIEARMKSKSLAVGLSDLVWTVIFPLHWLIDNYMVSQLEKQLKAFTATNEVEADQLGVLRAYFWLVQQPLSDSNRFKPQLPAANLRWVKTNSPVEHGLLLRSCVELLWYRDAGGTEWQDLVAAWVMKLPEPYAAELRALEVRLQEQTAFTSFATKPTLPPIGGGIRSSGAWLRDIWTGALQCEWKEVDRIAEHECARTPADSPLGRYLFDVRHFMRFHGKWGDDQTVGLSRRRLTISRFPMLVFDELRAAHGHILLGDLFRSRKNSGAHDRFHVFRLAMLHELEALRRWDMFAWFAAVRFRAKAHFEVLRHEPANVEFAWKAIIDALNSLSFDHDEPSHRDAIFALDFASEDVRVSIVEPLVNAPPLHTYEAMEIVENLGDAIPLRLLGRLADWSLRYLELSEARKLRGMKAFPLEFWRMLFPFADEHSPIWEKLAPQVEHDSRNVLLWQSAPTYLTWYIIRSPEHLALRIVDAMTGTAAGPGDAHFRWLMMLDILDDRPALASSLAPRLARIIPDPGTRYCLKSRLPTRPDLYGAVDDAKAYIRHRLQEMFPKAIYGGKGSTVQAPHYSGSGIWHVEWTDQDLPLFEALLAAVESPQGLAVYNRAFVAFLRGFVHAGPTSFVRSLMPHLNKWLRAPPDGIDPFSSNDGPFSSIRFWPSESGVARDLTFLARVTWERSQAGNTEAVREWLLAVLSTAPPDAAAALVAAALPIAHHTTDFQREEMLSAARSVLQTVWQQFADQPAVGNHLAEAIDQYRWVLGNGYALGSSEIKISPTFAETVVLSIAPQLVQFSKAFSFPLRRAVAELLSARAEVAALPAELDRVLHELKRDGRARVRRAAGVPN